MAFVQQPVQLAQRRHHVQEQQREREHVAAGDSPLNRHVNRDRQDQDMKQAFVDGLGAAKERHLDLMPQFHIAPAFRRLRQTIYFSAAGVGSPNVFNATQLFDHGSVDFLVSPQQAETHSFLRHDLSRRQIKRQRDDAEHCQTEHGLLASGGGKSKDTSK